MLHTIQASGGRIVSGGARLPATPENEPNLLPPPMSAAHLLELAKFRPAKSRPSKMPKMGPLLAGRSNLLTQTHLPNQLAPQVGAGEIC